MNDAVSNDAPYSLQGTEPTDQVSEILHKLNAYLRDCHKPSDEKNEKFPNLAGFCRYLGCGITELDGIRLAAPTLYDHICAILEDEALNAEISPTILTAYLKKRFGYAEKSEVSSSADCGSFRLIFEHDIMEDGS